MKPRYWKRKNAQEVLTAARKKVSRGVRYFADAKELLALVQEKLEVEQATLRTRIEALENPTFDERVVRMRLPLSGAEAQGEAAKAQFDRVLRELSEPR